jgi:hypothetical protein
MNRAAFLLAVGLVLAWQWWLWLLARFLHIHCPGLWLFPL